MMDALARLSADPEDDFTMGDERSNPEDDGECDGEDADAIGAYTQALLGGPKTWITIPREYWPAEWHGKFTDSRGTFMVTLWLVSFGSAIVKLRYSALVGNR